MDFIPIISTLRRHRTAALLVILEIAFTCAIVCNAVFVIRDRLGNMNRPSGVAEDELVQVVLTGIGQKADPDVITRQDLVALRALPGVKSVVSTNQLPFAGSAWSTSISTIADDPDPDPPINVARYLGGGGIVSTFGLHLIAGRDVSPTEIIAAKEADQTPTPCVIVTRSVAERLFPGDSALGKAFYMGKDRVPIIGIVDRLERPNEYGGVANRGLSIITPEEISYPDGRNYILRVDPAQRDAVIAAAEPVLRGIDPNRLVLDRLAFRDVRRKYFKQDLAMAWLLGIVVITLLVVTALGVVGLASFWVQQRTRQIGVRRALGATRGDILRYFQTENFILATAGIILGMVLAYAINMWMMDKYHVGRLPASFLPIGAGVLWFLGQSAVLGPALRAAAIPPAIATRSV
ncbi:ABC transporter permease [soil metagenome]